MREQMDIQVHIGSEIRKQLKEQKRSVSWLAEEIGCDNSSLSRRLKNQHINTKLLFQISIVLGKDFFGYCSKALSDTGHKNL